MSNTPITLTDIRQATRVADDMANEEQPNFSHCVFLKEHDGIIQNYRDLMLNGCAVDHSDLRDLDLTGLHLVDSTMIDSNLTGSQLSDAECLRTWFVGSDFTRSTLHYADFKEARMQETILIRANLTYASFRLVTGYRMQAMDAVACYAIFEQAMLNDANFTNTDLSCASFVQATLTGVNFTGAILANADLTNADLTGTQFHSLAQLQSTNLYKIKQCFMRWLIDQDQERINAYSLCLRTYQGEPHPFRFFGNEAKEEGGDRYTINQFMNNLVPSAFQGTRDWPVRQLIHCWIQEWIEACKKVGMS